MAGLSARRIFDGPRVYRPLLCRMKSVRETGDGFTRAF
jgi:hypothetical protein